MTYHKIANKDNLASKVKDFFLILLCLVISRIEQKSKKYVMYQPLPSMLKSKKII